MKALIGEFHDGILSVGNTVAENRVGGGHIDIRMKGDSGNRQQARTETDVDVLIAVVIFALTHVIAGNGVSLHAARVLHAAAAHGKNEMSPVVYLGADDGGACLPGGGESALRRILRFPTGAFGILRGEQRTVGGGTRVGGSLCRAVRGGDRPGYMA